MRCLSLFSGAGGLDIGLNTAGFEMVTSIEVDEDCCLTLKANHDWPVTRAKVGDVGDDFFSGLGELDLVAGGPPCQPFSKSALWTANGARGLADARATTLSEYFDAVEKCKPRAFLLENVDRFRSAGGLAQVEAHIVELRERGLQYSLNWAVLDAADFGVPQHRRRFVAWGFRDKEAPEFPAPTHGRDLIPYVTSWDAMSSAMETREEDLSVRGRWAGLLPSIPEGENYLWHSDRGGGLPLFGWRTRYWSFLKKLHRNIPSPTIVASPSQNSGPFHWDNRLLSTSELARLQTFPVGYTFVGGRASRQRQIGNAVPPRLAEVLGNALANSLGAHRVETHTFSIGRAETLPPAVKIGPVSDEFLLLQGSHSDHPGTGKGPKPRPVVQELEAAE
jgi:DNA (cytosine-5)-methyltransferase 1